MENDDKVAVSIANSARTEWNESRKAEIRAAKMLQSENIQSQMAAEIFNAVMAHLNSIPSPVKEKVIRKFHEIPLSNKVITL